MNTITKDMIAAYNEAEAKVAAAKQVLADAERQQSDAAKVIYDLLPTKNKRLNFPGRGLVMFVARENKSEGFTTYFLRSQKSPEASVSVEV